MRAVQPTAWVEKRFRRFVTRADERRIERVVGSRAGLGVVFGQMARRYDPAAAAGFGGALRFDLRREDGTKHVWSVMVSAGRARASAGPPTGPAVLVVKMSVADFARLAAGELDPGRALLSGALDLEGDFAVATRLGAMFGRPD